MKTAIIRCFCEFYEILNLTDSIKNKEKSYKRYN